MLRRLRCEDPGATMVEYALMLGLIALVCFAAVQLVGTGASTLWQTSATAISALP